MTLSPVQPDFSYRELKRRKDHDLQGAEIDFLRNQQSVRIGAGLVFIQLSLLISSVIVATKLYGPTVASLLAVLGIVVLIMARDWLARTKLSVWFYKLLEPQLIKAAQALTKFTPWLGRQQTKHRLGSKQELLELIEASPDALTNLDRRRLTGSLNYSGQKLTDCMVDWSQVETVDKTELLGPLRLDELHKTGHTQFPVMSGSVLAGLLDISHLVTLKSKRSLTAGSVMTDIYTIEQQLSIDQALHEFVLNSQNILVVRDGQKPIGIIQLATVLERITGIDYRSADRK